MQLECSVENLRTFLGDLSGADEVVLVGDHDDGGVRSTETAKLAKDFARVLVRGPISDGVDDEVRLDLRVPDALLERQASNFENRPL